MVISGVVELIAKITLPISNRQQLLVSHHPVEIINITIHNDYIDYEANIYKCHAVWTLYDDFR